MVTKEQIESVLERSREIMVRNVNKFKQITSGEDFQDWAFKTIKTVGKKQGIEFKEAGKLQFPDIYCGTYGIEVKFTKSDTWNSIGNSILEGTRVSEVNTIYIYFGKKGKSKSSPDIKWNLYEKCLSDIVVTHHPRYLIDMDMNEYDNIFNRMGISYDEFSSGDTLRFLKDYYRKLLQPGEELWWLGDARDEEDFQAASPLVLTDFRNMDRNAIRTESMVLHPDIFSNYRDKFFNLAIYLLKEYNAVSINLRDSFTGAGRETVKVLGGHVRLPKIYYYLYRHSKDIRLYLNETDANKLRVFWSRFDAFKNHYDESNIEASWVAILDSVASTKELPVGVKASDIYQSGLQS